MLIMTNQYSHYITTLSICCYYCVLSSTCGALFLTLYHIRLFYISYYYLVIHTCNRIIFFKTIQVFIYTSKHVIYFFVSLNVSTIDMM